MNEHTTEALQQMARHVAAQFVADALKDMVGPTMTLTIHPQTPKLLPPATSPRSSSPTKRAVRLKPGARKWTAAQRTKFKASMAARRQEKTAAPEKRKVGRPRKVVETDRCIRCDHTEGEHDPQTGECLSVRCSCKGFCT